jgi:hypothetical protein
LLTPLAFFASPVKGPIIRTSDNPGLLVLLDGCATSL